MGLSALGNSNEDGYGHNGDMAAAHTLMTLAAAVSWLPDDLGLWRDQAIDKLTRQGNIFLEMTLLHRGYWGGSILQDHGFTSMFCFVSAAYACRHVIQDAENWLAFGLARIRRTLQAMALDGIVPVTSYLLLYLYVDKRALLRELHLRCAGEDLYDNKAIQSIAEAAAMLYLPDRHAFAHPSPRADLNGFDGGQSFLAQFPDHPHAQRLLNQFMSLGNLNRTRTTSRGESHFQTAWLWAMLFDRTSPEAQQQRHSTSRDDHESDANSVSARWFKDSGVALLRTSNAMLVAKCGHAVSQNAHHQTTANPDRLCLAQLSGNFVYVHDGRMVLHTAEGGYCMHGKLGNVLLVEGQGQGQGQGQRGNVDMPMSHPDAVYHGEKILEVRQDRRCVRMDLAPAYEGLQRYTRSLSMSDRGNMTLVDEVEADGPRKLTWLFQTYQRNPWRQVESHVWMLTVDDQSYRFEITTTQCNVNVQVEPTKTVWAYVNANDNQPCHHLAVTTDRPVNQATLEMRVSITSVTSQADRITP